MSISKGIYYVTYCRASDYIMRLGFYNASRFLGFLGFSF